MTGGYVVWLLGVVLAFRIDTDNFVVPHFAGWEVFLSNDECLQAARKWEDEAERYAARMGAVDTSSRQCFPLLVDEITEHQTVMWDDLHVEVRLPSGSDGRSLARFVRVGPPTR